MKEKGFLASSILYVLLGLFLIMLIAVLTIYSNRKESIDQIKSEIITELENK